MIKREALKYLYDKVYRLTPEEVELAMQEASRAGQKAKEAYIEQLIERKRETFFTSLAINGISLCRIKINPRDGQ